MTDTVAVAKKKVSFSQLFRDRRMLVMLLLGVASGLPFAVITGTLNAWFTEYGISIATIGVFAWSGLAYSFKFLWSPALHRTPAPFFKPLGLRRSWFIPIQGMIALCFLGFSLLNPATSFGFIAILAVLGAFLSATFDIVVDAWRIETADTPEELDTLTTFYQGGYRSAAFIGGAGALILSDSVGWNLTLAILGVIMGLTMVAALVAPEPQRPEDRAGAVKTPEMFTSFKTGQRNLVLLVVLLGWAWAFVTLGWFMYAAISSPETAKAGEFTANLGWLIVLATVGLPAFGGIWLLRTRASDAADVKLPALPPKAQGAANTMFAAVIEPMVDVISRLRWAALLALAIILTYRFTDSVWGSFAYPFYMGTSGGALGHTATEVALASKMIGVVAIILGIVGGGILLKFIGRLPALVIAGALAAATNLLFYDLAVGAPVLDPVVRFLMLDQLLGVFGQDIRNARLITAILGENVAVGFASVAYVAYLSGIVNPKYAAVQYALLGSLTLLIGQLGKPALGAMIDTQGFAPAFVLVTMIGIIPVFLSLGEWYRQSLEKKRAAPAAQPAE